MKNQASDLISRRTHKKIPEKPLTEAQKIRYWAKLAEHMTDTPIHHKTSDNPHSALAQRIAEDLLP